MRDILFRFGRYFASVDFNERRIIKMWFAYRAINIYEEFRKQNRAYDFYLTSIWGFKIRLVLTAIFKEEQKKTASNCTILRYCFDFTF